MLNISRPHRPSDRASGGGSPRALGAGETAHVGETVSRTPQPTKPSSSRSTSFGMVCPRRATAAVNAAR
jgi:hypothetical protein